MENQAREPRTARTVDHHTATVDHHMATVTNLARLPTEGHMEVMDMEDLRDPKHLLEAMDTVDLRDPKLLEVMDMEDQRDPRHLEVMDMDMMPRDPRHLPREARMVTIKLLMIAQLLLRVYRKIDVYRYI